MKITDFVMNETANLVVSIIIPIYNVEDFLNECVESVVNQTYKNLQIILIDDGSKDSCGRIADDWEKKDERIVVVHKENAGLGYARNTGLDVATGDYVMFIDSDDYIDCRMVDLLINKMSDESADTVFCGMNRVTDDGNVYGIQMKYSGEIIKGENVVNKLLLEMVGSSPEEREDVNFYISACHALYSRGLIESHNIRFKSEREFLCEDLMFHIDYLRHANTIAVIHERLYYYRVRTSSITQKYYPDRADRQLQLSDSVCQCLKEFLPEEAYLFRDYRRVLAGMRGQIQSAVATKQKGIIRITDDICKKEKVQQILAVYPYEKNPWKHRVFNWGLRHRCALLLIILAKVNAIKNAKRELAIHKSKSLKRKWEE